MDRISADLAAYYENEASARIDRPIDAERVARRERFIEHSRSAEIASVLDVGMGPGRDAVAMRAAGIATVGLDLAHESARLALGDGVPSLQGSLFDLPVSTASFDAVWTMSTLVHVPDAHFDRAMSELGRIVRPGGFLAIGLWGGRDQEGVLHFDRDRPGRFFSLRTTERAERMVGRFGEIVDLDTWGAVGEHSWEYQFILVRIDGPREGARDG